MRDANKVTCVNRSSGAIPENAWTHLVVVVDRTNAKTLARRYRIKLG